MPFDEASGRPGRRPSLNVLGGQLDTCSVSPVTGFFRNGCCETGPEDLGVHTICCIVDAPFLYWSGDGEVAPLTSAELGGLRRFFALGGVLLVDDAAPGPRGEQSAFARSARREIARALPDTIPVTLGVESNGHLHNVVLEPRQQHQHHDQCQRQRA